MTGFGRADGAVLGRKVSVEIRSLNHRYLETSVRLPPRFAHVEAEVVRMLSHALARGKVELTVRENGNVGRIPPAWNPALAGQYVQLLRKEARRLRLKDDLALSNLLHLPDLFSSPRVSVAGDGEWVVVRRIVVRAIERCNLMRRREGQALKKDFLFRIGHLTRLVREIERHRRAIFQNQRERILKRVGQMAEAVPMEPPRVEEFVTLAAEKGDISEEVQRSKSHLGQMRRFLREDRPAGRRLDFLIQELQREINTIGSKAQGVALSNVVVEFKSELEKLREQVQNIE